MLWFLLASVVEEIKTCPNNSYFVNIGLTQIPQVQWVKAEVDVGIWFYVCLLSYKHLTLFIIYLIIECNGMQGKYVVVH
jgi:hypothetical protein